MDKSLRDILVIDIETVTEHQDYQEVPEALKAHWDRKSGFMRNEEDLSADELYFEKGAIYAEFGKVIVIGVGIFHQLESGETALRVRSFQDKDELQLLNEFRDFLGTKFDPERVRLCAHNGKEFDYPYLCRRMLLNGITIPYALDQSGKKPWEVQHLDTMELWRFGDRKSFTSLNLLTTIFGISSSKADIDGSQVNKVYYGEEDGLDRIANYCRGDIVATAQLYLKLKNLPLISEHNITVVDHKNE
ncbi:MAG: 3'-5' exonuclease [Cyclobacteriaceae bacterium]